MNSVAAYPDLHRAELALAEGRLDEASSLVVRHLRRYRDEPRGLALLGSVAFKNGALVQAEEFFRRAIARGARSIEVQRDLASVLHHQERLAEALSALSVLQQHLPNPEIRGSKAIVLEKLGRGEDALREHEALVAEFPENPRCWLGYGNSLRWAGRNDEAIAALRRAVSIDSEHGDVWWAIANIKEKVLTDADMEEMKSALDIAIDPRNIIPIHFSLGRAYHDREAFAEAFRHFEEGNRLRNESLSYVPEELSAEVDQIQRLFDHSFFKETDRPAQTDTPTPIFLISMPRSGSTLLETMLDQHPDIEAVGELPYARALVRSALELHLRRGPTTVPEVVKAMSPEEARAYGQDYMHRASMHWKERSRYFIDKMPMNWTEIPFIRRILPQAKFIEIRRDAMDCCFSNYMHYFSRAHSSSFALRDIGMAYVDLVRLTDHLRSVYPSLIHLVDYAELVGNPEPVLRQTLEYLELDWDPALLQYYESKRTVRTPSAEQVRQPLNRKGMGTWVPYRQWLGPLIEALGPLAQTDFADAEPA